MVERIVYALRVFGFYCHRYLRPLKRERGPKGGIKISSGSETGDFEGMLRIEVGQEEDSCLCRWIRGTCNTPHVYPDPDPPSQTPSTGECSCPDTLSYDRFSMNKKRPTAYDGSGALFLGRNWRL